MKASKTTTAPTELTDQQKAEVLAIFDRMAYVKIYSTLNDHAEGHKGTRDVTQLNVLNYYNNIAEKQKAGTPFQDAIKYLMQDGFLSIPPKESKQQPGTGFNIVSGKANNKVYRFSKTFFDRYRASIQLTPERKTAVCRALMEGLLIFSPCILMARLDYLHAIKKGLTKLNYQIPPNPEKLLYYLMDAGLLLVGNEVGGKDSFIHIKQSTGIKEYDHSIAPSEGFLRRYAKGTVWYKPIHEKDYTKEMDEAYYKGTAKAALKQMKRSNPAQLPE
ncbi:hypothetical protein [Marinilabilia rubra]|nr:hypothetical protein [Marinilabilia rubra]